MSRDASRRILLVDRHRGRAALQAALAASGYSVVSASGHDEALDVLRNGFEPCAVVLGDPGAPRSESLAALAALAPGLAVVVVGSEATRGVVDGRGPRVGWVGRDGAPDGLDSALVRALEARPVSAAGSEGDDGMIVGSPAMRAIRELVRQVADTDVPVLITGDSGVGKEVIARALHADSGRRLQSLVKVNCAALPDQLLESELFGYEKGAFTGAEQNRPGKFELADGGTIFLDEIGEISGGTQAKLLQVLQDGCYFRLGGNREISVDARVVSSTNRRLEAAMTDGTFRTDLFYRLNVVRIEVPRLRERREEIPMLAAHFLGRYEREYGRQVGTLPDDALQALMRHDWPGNVRELENVVRRMVVLQDVAAGLVALTPIRPASEAGGFDLEAMIGPGGAIPPLKEVSKLAALEVEGELIRRALEQTRWNRRQAAKLLDISYKALLYKIRDCGITAA